MRLVQVDYVAHTVVCAKKHDVFIIRGIVAPCRRATNGGRWREMRVNVRASTRYAQ